MAEAALETWLPALINGKIDAATLSQLPLLDEYRLLQPLGSGAMGCVYAAHDTVLDRPVAIKLLSTIGADSRERFLIEARAIARLVHPNVVAIHRVGAIGDVPFLVSEYVRGESLNKLPLPLPSDEVFRIAIELARGLAAAHRRGVLHRDLKPANAIRTTDGTVKLLDFGLAKLSAGKSELELPAAPSLTTEDVLARTPLFDSAEPPRSASAATPRAIRRNVSELLDSGGEGALANLTQAGAQMGTPLYMAPEMWRGEEATPCVDIYSLGALLYELASGHPPHLADKVPELAQRVVDEDAPSLHDVAPQLDSGLAAIIDRCLRREPQERFANADVLLEALEGLRAQQTLGPARPAGLRRWALPGIIAGGLATVAMAVPASRNRIFGALHLQRRGDTINLEAALARTPLDMVLVPGRTFVMGATAAQIDAAFRECPNLSRHCKRESFDWQQPTRTVTVSAFYLDRFEVTNKQYADWLNLPLQPLTLTSGRLVYSGKTLLCDLHPNASGIERQSDRYVARPGAEALPVLQVTWQGAKQYCQAHGKSLPSEAQWELAAQGVSRQPGASAALWPWGLEAPRCDGVTMAREPGEVCAHLPHTPSPVGKSAQDVTPHGAYDLGGNAREWVLDRFLARYPDCGACKDPVVSEAPEEAGGASFRAVRGGNYLWSPQAAQSTERSRWREDVVATGIGFRCAMRISP